MSEHQPHERARAVHHEMAGLQQQANDATASLRARRRARRRQLSVQRSLWVALVFVVFFAVAVVALDVWEVRTTVVHILRRDVVDPSQGR